MEIYDEITLDGLIEEALEWLKDIKKKCNPSGPWWNDVKNRPEIGGIFLKLIYIDGQWCLDDSGVYDIGKCCLSRSKFKYTLKFVGVDWTEETLKKEVIKQYKEFLNKAKILKLEEDFK